MANNDKDFSNLNEDLANFVRKESGTYDISIGKNTEIEKDLGVTGDDAEDFILKFSKKFKVDISKFQFTDYFNDEPSVFSFGRSVKTLTIGHLEKAIQAGRLDDNIINDKPEKN